MPNDTVRIENDRRHKKKNDKQKHNTSKSKTVPDWDTLWKDEELREDFVAAVRANEEWIRQAEWLKVSAPVGRSIQRQHIDSHFEKCEDVMTRWAKHFAQWKTSQGE